MAQNLNTPPQLRILHILVSILAHKPVNTSWSSPPLFTHYTSNRTVEVKQITVILTRTTLGLKRTLYYHRRGAYITILGLKLLPFTVDTKGWVLFSVKRKINPGYVCSLKTVCTKTKVDRCQFRKQVPELCIVALWETQCSFCTRLSLVAEGQNEVWAGFGQDDSNLCDASQRGNQRVNLGDCVLF